MTRLALALTLLAAPAYAEPNDLIPDSAFIIGFTHHAGGSSREQTGWTDSGDPTYRNRWDEGFGPRGLGLTWKTTHGDISASAYKNSLHDGGMGYSLSYSSPAFLEYGGVSAHGVAQINLYPEEPTTDLEETNGWFPSFGVSMRYEHESGAGVFVNVYPDLGDRNSFGALYVVGVSWGW